MRTSRARPVDDADRERQQRELLTMTVERTPGAQLLATNPQVAALHRQAQALPPAERAAAFARLMAEHVEAHGNPITTSPTNVASHSSNGYTPAPNSANTTAPTPTTELSTTSRISGNATDSGVPRIEDINEIVRKTLLRIVGSDETQPISRYLRWDAQRGIEVYVDQGRDDVRGWKALERVDESTVGAVSDIVINKARVAFGLPGADSAFADGGAIATPPPPKHIQKLMMSLHQAAEAPDVKRAGLSNDVLYLQAQRRAERLWETVKDGTTKDNMMDFENALLQMARARLGLSVHGGNIEDFEHVIRLMNATNMAGMGLAQAGREVADARGGYEAAGLTVNGTEDGAVAFGGAWLNMNQAIRAETLGFDAQAWSDAAPQIQLAMDIRSARQSMEFGVVDVGKLAAVAAVSFAAYGAVGAVFESAAGAAFAGGAAGNFVGSGGDLEAALRGGVTGMLTAGIGNQIGTTYTDTPFTQWGTEHFIDYAGNAIARGAIAEANGGDFAASVISTSAGVVGNQVTDWLTPTFSTNPLIAKLVGDVTATLIVSGGNPHAITHTLLNNGIEALNRPSPALAMIENENRVGSS